MPEHYPCQPENELDVPHFILERQNNPFSRMMPPGMMPMPPGMIGLPSDPSTGSGGVGGGGGQPFGGMPPFGFLGPTPPAGPEGFGPPMPPMLPDMNIDDILKFGGPEGAAGDMTAAFNFGFPAAPGFPAFPGGVGTQGRN